MNNKQHREPAFPHRAKQSGQPQQNLLQLLAANVLRLSTLLTRGREQLPTAYLKEAGLRKAYLEYFLPPNRAKIHHALADLLLHPAKIFSKKRLRVLDIGSGPGTAVLGTLDFFSQQPEHPFLEFTAHDQLAENLKESARLFAQQTAQYPGSSLSLIRSGMNLLASRLEGRYDLIILSNVLNELFVADEARQRKRTDLVSDLMQRFLAADGSCIIIEPALQETSRGLLMVRDGLREKGFSVYSPCLRQGPCPALVNPKDWCHEDIPWEPPALIREIDKLIGLRKDSLKFSYMVMRSDRRSLTDVFGGQCFRVVSEPLASKGKAEFYLCGAAGRKLATRLDKDEASLNRSFKDLRRGDIAVIKDLLDAGNRYKVGKETSVTLKRLLGADKTG